ncbi:hypothetical protein ACFZAM_02925 [Streptomyces sp. NPDC008079]|uniref:hypothetical protein n=1 Tax=Streptomyces sp. NPDC008079 TaxID=3364806 RepID=UPI0036EFBC03
MPKKTERIAPLPAGLFPLLSQKQLETYYGVSATQVLKWLDMGMPEEPYEGRGRKFDLSVVKAWHAEHSRVADRIPTREEALADARRALVAAARVQATQTPREAAEAAWYPGHRLGTVEAIEAVIIRRRVKHCAGCAAIYGPQADAAEAIA